MTRWTGPLRFGRDGARHPRYLAADCYETESGKRSWMNRRKRYTRKKYAKYSFLASKKYFQFTLQWQKSYFQTLSGKILEVIPPYLTETVFRHPSPRTHKHTPSLRRSSRRCWWARQGRGKLEWPIWDNHWVWIRLLQHQWLHWAVEWVTVEVTPRNSVTRSGCSAWRARSHVRGWVWHAADEEEKKRTDNCR